jgi:hypothetical protein
MVVESGFLWLFVVMGRGWMIRDGGGDFEGLEIVVYERVEDEKWVLER